MNTLGLFTKFWQPGTVKTRLAATLGNVKAAEIHQQLFRHLLKTLNQSGDKRCVVVWPPRHCQDVQQSIERIRLAAHWEVEPQPTGDLGDKMRDFFKERFAAGDQKVVVIGSDCPNISVAQMETAFAQLDRHDVVLGPSLDGGYYLIGLKKDLGALFERMPWSKPSLLHETRARIKNHGMSLTELETLDDIDNQEDLSRFLELCKGKNGSKPIRDLGNSILEIIEQPDSTIEQKESSAS